MKRCLKKTTTTTTGDNFIKIQLRVPPLISNGWRGYQNRYDEWLNHGPFTPFGWKMIVGCTAGGFMLGGYIIGKNAPKYSVDVDTGFGCFYGTIGGIVIGALWPILPFIPVPYVMYKGVRVLVDRKRKEKGYD